MTHRWALMQATDKDYLAATPTLHFRSLRRRAGLPLWLWAARERSLRAVRGLRARLARAGQALR